jgi:type 1 glutamine amidotransferase
MPEFFIQANSFAAPFVSDTSDVYVEADTPEAALEAFAADYRHPCGLYAAEVYPSADAMHKGRKPLARWVCNHELARRRLTKGKEAHSYLGHSPGDFEINGDRHKIEDPKAGRVVPA